MQHIKYRSFCTHPVFVQYLKNSIYYVLHNKFQLNSKYKGGQIQVELGLNRLKDQNQFTKTVSIVRKNDGKAKKAHAGYEYAKTTEKLRKHMPAMNW